MTVQETIAHDAYLNSAYDISALPTSAKAVIDQLSDLVSSNNLNVDPTILQMRASALFAQLKALNRAANAATKTRKQATTDARLEMDHTHLGLENLLYEKRHLEREIDKCRQFASIYQDVPLYSLEEFMQLAPEAARPESIHENQHQLMLNRLSFELAERQRLDSRRKELQQEKEDLLKQSKAKQTMVDTVKSHIDSLMKNATDTQKKIDDLVAPLSVSASQSQS